MSTAEPISELKPEQLQVFPPLQALGETERRILAARVTPRLASRGDTLFRAGDNDSNEVFLLSGRIKLVAEDGRERIVEADSEAGHQPLAHLKPRRYTAQALESCHYFLLSSAVWEAILEQAGQGPGDAYQVDELDRSAEAGAAVDLLRRMEALWGTDDVLLPVNPAVVDSLRMGAEQLEIDPDWLANASYGDPATAAYFMRAANSLVYADMEPCDTVYEAVVRLGPIVTKAILQTLINGASTQTDEALALWLRKSRFVSAICFELARQCGNFRLEQAATAGLLCNIGVILRHRLNVESEASDSGRRYIQTPIDLAGANQLGAYALRHWGFPVSYAECALHYHSWQRDNPGSADLCDLVLMATAVSRIGERQRGDGPAVNGLTAPPRLTALPALKKLPAVLQEPKVIARVVTNAKQRLRTLNAESQLVTH